MKVSTQSPKLAQLRRASLICTSPTIARLRHLPANGHCELQDMAADAGITEPPTESPARSTAGAEGCEQSVFHI